MALYRARRFSTPNGTNVIELAKQELLSSLPVTILTNHHGALKDATIFWLCNNNFHIFQIWNKKLLLHYFTILQENSRPPLAASPPEKGELFYQIGADSNHSPECTESTSLTQIHVIFPNPPDTSDSLFSKNICLRFEPV